MREPKKTFYHGDRVVYTGDYSPLLKGKLGTVIGNSSYGADSVDVEWDDPGDSPKGVYSHNLSLTLVARPGNTSEIVWAFGPGLTIGKMQEQAWEQSVKSGFGDLGVPTAIALIHSEASEALEADRNPSDYFAPAMGMLPQSDETEFTHFQALAKALQREHFAEELADVVIRVGCLAGQEGLDLEAAIIAKMEKNSKRDFKHNGKSY